MPRFVPYSLVLVGLLGCGDDGSTAPVDATLTNVQPLCTGSVTITGTYAPQNAPDPTMGCQPAGGLGSGSARTTVSATWTVNVTVSDMGNCQSIPANPSYSYTVTENGSANDPGHTVAVAYGSAATGEMDNFTISGDNAQCTGQFDHILPMGSNFAELNLRPRTQTFSDPGFNGTLTGSGEFDLWPPAFGSNFGSGT